MARGAALQPSPTEWTLHLRVPRHIVLLKSAPICEICGSSIPEVARGVDDPPSQEALVSAWVLAEKSGQ